MSRVFYAKNGTAYTKDENGKPKFISKEEAERLEMIEEEEQLATRTYNGFVVVLITSLLLLAFTQVSL